MDRRQREFTNRPRTANPGVDHYELLRQAIANQQSATASYQGSRRQFCPHVLGRKAGHHVVLVYQYTDSARAGAAGAGWQCFALDRLHNISLLGSRWRSGEPDTLPADCIDAVDAAVEGFDTSLLGPDVEVAPTSDATLTPLRKQAESKEESAAAAPTDEPT